MSKKSDKIIGIDLGSYNSSVSVYEGNEVKVIANSKRNIIPVVDNCGILCGIILLDDIRDIMFKRELYEITPVTKFMKMAPENVY